MTWTREAPGQWHRPTNSGGEVRIKRHGPGNWSWFFTAKAGCAGRGRSRFPNAEDAAVAVEQATGESVLPMPWHDCPACPKCTARVGVTARFAEHDPRAAHDLYCPACGHTWTGSEAERAQAVAADTAWREHEDDASGSCHEPSPTVNDPPIVAADLPPEDTSGWTFPPGMEADEGDVKTALQKAIAEHGGVRALARASNLSPAYVSRCSTGRERVAGDLARFLGFERITIYRRIS